MSVRDAVLARTAGLDPGARDLADLLACAPGAVPDTLLPALGVGIGPLRTLDTAGLIARDRRGITYRHDICRLAVAGAIPPGGEIDLHRRMTEALETLPDPDPAVLAHHALAAGDAGRVFRYAARAGRVAAGSGAHTEAARFFTTALEHAPQEADAARAGLCELLAHELFLTNRLDEAIAACHRAIAWRRAEDDLDGVGAGHRSLASFEWYHGNRDRAVAHAATAIEVLGPRAVPGSPAAGHSRPRAVHPGVPRDAGQRPGDGTRSPRSSPRRRRRRRGRRPRGQDAGGRHRGRDDGGRSLRAGPAPGRARGGRRRDQGRALHLLDPARAPRRRTAPSRRGRDRARPEPATDRAVGVPAVRALAARHACAPARDARRLGRGRPRRPRRARRQRVGADPHLALVGAGTRRAAPRGRGRRRPPRARLGSRAAVRRAPASAPGRVGAGGAVLGDRHDRPPPRPGAGDPRGRGHPPGHGVVGGRAGGVAAQARARRGRRRPSRRDRRTP